MTDGPSHTTSGTSGSAPRRASRTALRVAALRALHQSRETPPIFVDPLAVRILGSSAAQVLADTEQEEARLRASIAVRSRLAEDVLAAAAGCGVDQYVVLGAGLDTFAYRNPHSQLAVYEVDHVGTQAWKRDCLNAAGIDMPSSARHVAVDFEADELLDALEDAGFDPRRPAVFAMLGVAFYVELASLLRTWQRVASCARGTQMVFDYIPVLDDAPEAIRSVIAAATARVAKEGEPWVTYFEPPTLHRELRDLGFSEITDMATDDLHARYLADRNDGFKLSPFAHIVTARV